MQFKITKQYSRDEENPLAEFCEYVDVILFIETKISSDDSQKLKLIYRTYDGDKLINEYNKEKFDIPLRKAQYAAGDRDLPNSFLHKFKVIKQSVGDIKSRPIAEFGNLYDAKIFVEARILADIEAHANEIYRIFDNENFLESWDQDKIDAITNQTQELRGKPRNVSFRPTPLSTSPRPPGTPPPWIIDEDDDKDKQDE